MAWESPRPRREVNPTEIFRFTAVLVVVVVAGFSLLFYWKNWSDKRHPAVVEHRAELMQRLAKDRSCDGVAPTVTVEGPRRARIEGCRDPMIFVWKRPHRNSRETLWMEIDPNCHYGMFGFSFPCD